MKQARIQAILLLLAGITNSLAEGCVVTVYHLQSLICKIIKQC